MTLHARLMDPRSNSSCSTSCLCISLGRRSNWARVKSRCCWYLAIREWMNPRALSQSTGTPELERSHSNCIVELNPWKVPKCWTRLDPSGSPARR